MKKLEKNKTVFIMLITSVVLFLIAYYVFTFAGEDEVGLDKHHIPVPELKDEQTEYESKIEALENISEERVKDAPSVYPKHMFDDNGFINPDYLEMEKQRIIDSIYRDNSFTYGGRLNLDTLRQINPSFKIAKKEINSVVPVVKKNMEVASEELGLEHQLFFASNPITEIRDITKSVDSIIIVTVDGSQTVRRDYRLKMRLSSAIILNGKHFPKNTAVYGFIQLRPNRAMIEITNIARMPVKLKAYDMQDGNEGVYVENNIKAEVSKQAIGEIMEEINVAGLPQLSGIKKIFQRNHSSDKVTILNNYKLILK